MKERPVIFTGDSVRSILAGRKTQTRRICRVQPLEAGGLWQCLYPWGEGGHGIYESESEMRQEYDRLMLARCPYGKPGDRLWVRETWATDFEKNVLYRTTDPSPSPMGAYGAKRMVDGAKSIWRSPIHMPRWASRITLEITGVRVERLQEISEADAIAEGLIQWSSPRMSNIYYGVTQADVWESNPRKTYARLWDSINSKRASWESNPLVWVAGFKML